VKSEGKSVRNNPVNTKVHKKGGGGGAPCVGADSPATCGADLG